MKLRYVKSLAIPALVAFCTFPLAARGQLIDLGEVTGYAINNAGQVALSTGLYSDGTVTALPALPGSTTPAVPLAINASGWAAGNAIAPIPTDHPVAYINGSLIDFAASMFAVTLSENSGSATGINSSGEVVGWVYYAAGGAGAPTVGITYLNGTLATMSVPCGANSTLDCSAVADNMPYGINDSGKITGTVVYNVDAASFVSDAYIYDGTWTDLGPGTGYAINDAGQVTGQLEIVNNTLSAPDIISMYAFLYTNGMTTNLGTLPGGKNSVGYAINATGQIVGSSDFAGSGNTTHAFLYNGAMNDLNTLISATDPLKPYVTLTSAVGINDSLLILVNGVDSRTPNVTHAYLYQASFIQLTPSSLDFAMLTVGDKSQAQSVTVTNAGTTTIPFGTAYVNGDFSLRADNCGTSLGPGDQCRISVVFLPKVVGVLSGALSIPAGGANYQVPLSGVAPITAKISGSSSTATVGQPLTLTWTVSAGSTCTASSTAGTPAFTGAVLVNGKQTLTETAAGAVTYQLNCTAPGVAAVSASASVVWSWPVVTATITASPTTITAGQTTTLTWKSSNATSCTATGGGADDNWAGTKLTSGTQTVTEAVALDTSSVVLTFWITCNSTTSGLSDKASVNVTENQAPASSSAPTPPASSGGGGGALNPLSLALLAGILGLRRVRIRIARP